MDAAFDQQSYRILFGLFQLVVLSLLIERGLYFIFDWRPLRAFLAKRGIKGPIALGISWFICWRHDFDIVARAIDPGASTPIGTFITACIVAGGSAAAMILFDDVLKFTRAAREGLKKQTSP